MSVDFLIDGYNLLHFAGLARARYGPGDLERARDRLLKRIRNGLNEAERGRVTVVFDARDAEHADRREARPFGMRVLFSPIGREADDTIEELIEAHASPRNLLVISSDNRLKRAARAARAGWMDSDSFLVDLDRRQAQLQQPETPATDSPPVASRSAHTSLPDLSAEFGNIDVAALLRETSEKELPARASPQTVPPPKPAATKPERAAPAGTKRGTKSPAAGSKPRVREVAATDQPLEDMESALLDELSRNQDAPELAFWEQRVKELLDEEKDKR